MERPLTYLACPYSHADPAIKHARFEAANKASARLMKAGLKIYSPISHTHPIALAGELPGDWQFWEQYDRAFLAASNKLVVLMIDGWQESTGVTAELAIAKEMGIDVEYITE